MITFNAHAALTFFLVSILLVVAAANALVIRNHTWWPLRLLCAVSAIACSAFALGLLIP